MDTAQSSPPTAVLLAGLGIAVGLLGVATSFTPVRDLHMPDAVRDFPPEALEQGAEWAAVFLRIADWAGVVALVLACWGVWLTLKVRREAVGVLGASAALLIFSASFFAIVGGVLLVFAAFSARRHIRAATNSP